MLQRLSFYSTLLALAAAAQTSRGTVTGLVNDAQKAAIANAPVELANLATGVSRSTQSNESGLYRFDAVDPGEYRVTVKMPGFRTMPDPRSSSARHKRSRSTWRSKSARSPK